MAAGGMDIRAGDGSMDEDLEDGSDRHTSARGEEADAPQSYQYGSGAGGWSTEEIQKLVEGTVVAILHSMGKGAGKVLERTVEGRRKAKCCWKKGSFGTWKSSRTHWRGGTDGCST